METKLKGFKNNEEHKEIIFSDNGYGKVGWLSIRIGDEMADIHITDLMPAIIGFDAKFSRNIEE